MSEIVEVVPTGALAMYDVRKGDHALTIDDNGEWTSAVVISGYLVNVGPLDPSAHDRPHRVVTEEHAFDSESLIKFGRALEKMRPRLGNREMIIGIRVRDERPLSLGALVRESLEGD